MMPTMLIVFLVVSLLIFLAAEGWIRIYNDFQVKLNLAERVFANVDIIMAQRESMIAAMVESVRKYDVHEYKALKDTIKARSRMASDTPINNRIEMAQSQDQSLIKLNAVFEKYPKLKASTLHQSVIGTGSISEIENKLAEYRLAYDLAAQEYNTMRVIFPRRLIANLCGFTKLSYISLGNSVSNADMK